MYPDASALAFTPLQWSWPGASLSALAQRQSGRGQNIRANARWQGIYITAVVRTGKLIYLDWTWTAASREGGGNERRGLSSCSSLDSTRDQEGYRSHRQQNFNSGRQQKAVNNASALITEDIYYFYSSLLNKKLHCRYEVIQTSLLHLCCYFKLHGREKYLDFIFTASLTPNSHQDQKPVPSHSQRTSERRQSVRRLRRLYRFLQPPTPRKCEHTHWLQWSQTLLVQNGCHCSSHHNVPTLGSHNGLRKAVISNSNVNVLLGSIACPFIEDMNFHTVDKRFVIGHERNQPQFNSANSTAAGDKSIPFSCCIMTLPPSPTPPNPNAHKHAHHPVAGRCPGSPPWPAGQSGSSRSTWPARARPPPAGQRSAGAGPGCDPPWPRRGKGQSPWPPAQWRTPGRGDGRDYIAKVQVIMNQ